MVGAQLGHQLCCVLGCIHCQCFGNDLQAGEGGWRRRWVGWESRVVHNLARPGRRHTRAGQEKEPSSSSACRCVKASPALNTTGRCPLQVPPPISAHQQCVCKFGNGQLLPAAQRGGKVVQVHVEGRLHSTAACDEGRKAGRADGSGPKGWAASEAGLASQQGRARTAASTSGGCQSGRQVPARASKCQPATHPGPHGRSPARA